MAPALFAEIHVRDFRAAKPWYVRLLGEPAFATHDTEEVWELAENRSIAGEEQPGNAGHSAITAFVDDLDTLIEGSSRLREDTQPVIADLIELARGPSGRVSSAQRRQM